MEEVTAATMRPEMVVATVAEVVAMKTVTMMKTKVAAVAAVAATQAVMTVTNAAATMVMEKRQVLFFAIVFWFVVI